jgi:hypothetical protein
MPCSLSPASQMRTIGVVVGKWHYFFVILVVFNRFLINLLKINVMNSININSSFQQLAEAVRQLSPADKLKLNEVIWSENTIIPSEHQKLVLDRMNKAKQKPEMMLDWNEALKTL